MNGEYQTPHPGPLLCVPTGKRNAIKEFCQVRYVVHKHELQELAMTRTLKHWGYLNVWIFVKHALWLIHKHEYFNAVTNFIYF